VVPLNASHACVINNTGSKSYEQYCANIKEFSDILHEERRSFSILQERIRNSTPLKIQGIPDSRRMFIKTHKRSNFTRVIVSRNYFKKRLTETKCFISGIHLALFAFVCFVLRSIDIIHRLLFVS